MNLLTAKHLQLTLDKHSVVDNVSITLEKNEFVGLIGPNGAGKSSILRLLAGLVKPNGGKIELWSDGTLGPAGYMRLEKIKAAVRARFMAYLAQHETPAWPLSVRNIVALGRSPWDNSFSNAVDEAAINHALQITDIGGLAGRPINELSGGELQRVLLARVFAGEPQLIVADEPIAALDVYHQLHIMELLQVHAQKGGAVIAALHDLSLAARFCSRLILVNHGKVVAEGQPVAVLTPENLAQVYGVSAHVDCRDDGVVIIPVKRVTQL